jgi:hypothetical protein
MGRPATLSWGFWSSRQLLELLHQFGGDVQADILGERLTGSSVSEIPRMHRELDLYPEVDQAIVLLTEGRKKSNPVLGHLTSFGKQVRSLAKPALSFGWMGQRLRHMTFHRRHGLTGSPAARAALNTSMAASSAASVCRTFSVCLVIRSPWFKPKVCSVAQRVAQRFSNFRGYVRLLAGVRWCSKIGV